MKEESPRYSLWLQDARDIDKLILSVMQKSATVDHAGLKEKLRIAEKALQDAQAYCLVQVGSIIMREADD